MSRDSVLYAACVCLGLAAALTVLITCLGGCLEPAPVQVTATGSADPWARQGLLAWSELGVGVEETADPDLPACGPRPYCTGEVCRLEVALVEVDLGPGLVGGWAESLGRLVYAPGLSPRERQAVVGHELGHALGLDHSDVTTALMWRSTSGALSATSDDIAAAWAVCP